MKIILLKDVKGQGKKHEVIEVKDGYGNNFLIKNGLGVLATEESIKRLKKDVQSEIDHENELIKKATEIKKELENKIIPFKLKTGASDRTFGTISAKQIADALKKMGYEVDKKKIIIDGTISSLGFHEVMIELHKKVIAKVRVEITKEK